MFGLSYSSSTSSPRPTQGCLQPLLSTDSWVGRGGHRPPSARCNQCIEEAAMTNGDRTKQEAAVAVHSQRQTKKEAKCGSSIIASQTVVAAASHPSQPPPASSTGVRRSKRLKKEGKKMINPENKNQE
uniref:Uncharacterized protein n=2 Tax=Trichuris muris TaxID=70415 RepID=A0A5S6QWM2_TRIMR